MTQAELGLSLGVSNKAVSFYETGTSEPSLASLAKIAMIGKRTLDWLITGIEPACIAAVSSGVNYSLAEDEQRALHTAEDLLKYKGLDKHYAVTEIHHPTGHGEKLNYDEKELLEAFRLVDRTSKNMLLQVANHAALAFRQGAGRNSPEENSSPAANCA